MNTILAIIIVIFLTFSVINVRKNNKKDRRGYSRNEYKKFSKMNISEHSKEIFRKLSKGEL